ncbi:MAG: hypothetical protein KIS87_01940 [Phycisphaeraceae bacterium]|nr:hypothetical protein [Phycisphaeraceae bacterium]
MLKRLGNLFGGAKRSEPSVRVAVFGKHPGWDDHIEDFPLESQELAWVKRRLYVEGIASNIDAAAWERLDPSSRVEGFRHLVVWRIPPGIVIARLWSSSDGKGRAQYPMVVAVQCEGVSMAWALEQVPRRLDWFEGKCVQTRERSVVVQAMTRLTQELRDAASKVRGIEPAPSRGARPTALAEIAARPELGPGRVGYHRLMYAIEQELGAYRPIGNGGSTSRSRTAEHVRGKSIRVPRCGDTPASTALLWHRFFTERLAPGVPFALILTMRGKWVDVLVGEPHPGLFFCLQAADTAVPLTTDVPFNLDPDFVAHAEEAARAAGVRPAV